MSNDIIDTILESLNDTSIKILEKEDMFLFKYGEDTEVKITKYYDIENIPHLKFDFGFETYILTMEEGV